jgi:hypothetical protein
VAWGGGHHRVPILRTSATETVINSSGGYSCACCLGIQQSGSEGRLIFITHRLHRHRHLFFYFICYIPDPHHVAICLFSLVGTINGVMWGHACRFRFANSNDAWCCGCAVLRCAVVLGLRAFPVLQYILYTVHEPSGELRLSELLNPLVLFGWLCVRLCVLLFLECIHIYILLFNIWRQYERCISSSGE